LTRARLLRPFASTILSASFAIRATTVAAAFVLPLVAMPGVAAAQPVSDADKKAARDLFYAGVELQNAGRFPEALDKFQRAQAVFNAPTHLLHIAECEAAMGRLVEAYETYRALSRLDLGASPPQVFVQAKSQGDAEARGIEPRIPQLKIDVAPPNVPTLTVTIDDQPMNTALVGAERPVNPGTHKVAASAPGYSRAEQVIQIGEKEKKSVTLTLSSTGGVVYGPAGAVGAGTGVGTGTGTGTGTPPPPDASQPSPMKPKELGSKSSLFLGVRLGGYVPAGSYPTGRLAGSSDTSESLSTVAGAGAAIGVEGAFRFARVFYIGAFLQGAAFGKKVLDPGPLAYDTSMTTGMLMGTLGYISNADGVGFLLDLGLGYRGMGISYTGVNSSSPDRPSDSFDGLEFQIGMGVPIKVGKSIRIIPKIDLDFGSFQQNIPNTSSGTGLTGGNSVFHAFFFFGVGGYFDIDLDPKKPAPATTTPPAAPAATPAPAK
jgi:hypothetical protein